jgi:hypothetical protein
MQKEMIILFIMMNIQQYAKKIGNLSFPLHTTIINILKMESTSHRIYHSPKPSKKWEVLSIVRTHPPMISRVWGPLSSTTWRTLLITNASNEYHQRIGKYWPVRFVMGSIYHLF